jgi:hypothetical protein
MKSAPQIEEQKLIDLEDLSPFRKGLSELIAKGEIDPKMRSEIIKLVVHRIEILKDGFELQFYVGEAHYLALGKDPGASFFVPFFNQGPKTKKPSGGYPEGSVLKQPCQLSKNLLVKSSRRLTNGGPDRDRTDDLHNAIVTRSQLRYRPLRISAKTTPI